MVHFQTKAVLCKLLPRHLPPVRIMHTSPMLISAATMSNMTVLDIADPYDLDMTSSEAIYPISFQVLQELHAHVSDMTNLSAST